jgi:hypothetical protein
MEYILRTNTVSKKYTNYYAVDKVSISIQKRRNIWLDWRKWCW